MAVSVTGAWGEAGLAELKRVVAVAAGVVITV
jgi:hypothetical protein